MTKFVHDLVDFGRRNFANKAALVHKNDVINYLELSEQIDTIASGYCQLGLARFDRIGVYLHKTFTTVTSMFAASKMGSVFVPINPILKAPQVVHIATDCDIKLLITNKARFTQLKNVIEQMPALEHVILVDINEPHESQEAHVTVLSWLSFSERCTDKISSTPVTSQDMAAILYTSGSTGKPKGVVLSHQNIVLGGHSVAEYLENTADDVVLAALPLSFDYGFSQLTTSFSVGATCVLLDYLLPQDVLKAIDKHKVTGLAAVPPLWAQLCKLDWQAYDTSSVRYFTNSGGALTLANLTVLRERLPQASPYLMYGLTEAFRSTYLPPSEVDNRQGSMGKAIPNAEVLVINEQGQECQANEPGELVHLGPLVSLGYWNNQEKTDERFKPAPFKTKGLILPEIAVWSGDKVRKDEQGYLYFIARQDEMIKTSGYRVSPMEIEETLYQHESIVEAAVVGAKHEDLGQAIIVVASAKPDTQLEEQDVTKFCRSQLPAYMVPLKVIILDELPHNANGKIDRSLLNKTYQNFFMEQA